VFELLGVSADLQESDRQRMQAYENGLACYRSRDWEGAETAFHESLRLAPGDGPSQTMLARVAEFRQHPPAEGWGGVWIAMSK
jgi:adenylate cyclase